MESDANTRLSRGFSGLIGLVSAVDLARLRAESDAAAHAAGSPGAVSGGNTAEPAVVRDRNLRAWVAVLVGVVVLACIALVDIYAAAFFSGPGAPGGLRGAGSRIRPRHGAFRDWKRRVTPAPDGLCTPPEPAPDPAKWPGLAQCALFRAPFSPARRERSR